MDQQNYELDQTGAEETPKTVFPKLFRSQRDRDRCDRNTSDKLDGNQCGMSGNKFTDPDHEQGKCR